MESVLALSILAAPKLSGGRAGALTSPFKTAQAAVKKANYPNQHHIGAMVTVSAGAYREFVNLVSFKANSAPPTFDYAVIVGSKALTRSLAAGGKRTRGWYHTSPICGFPAGRPTSPAPIALRTEVVFAGDATHMQITAVDAGGQRSPG